MQSRTDLKYRYEPESFFEAPLSTTVGPGEIAIAEGTAVLSITPSLKVSHEEVRNLTRLVRSVFQARQLLTHEPFTIQGPEIVHHDDNGRKHHVLLVQPATVEARAMSVDFRLVDSTGQVVRDTRAERISHDSNFVVDVVARTHATPILQKVLDSYEAAVNDPGNELTHLYEIRDAIAKHFGGEPAARHALALSADDWKLLGKLANAEPLAEGRHRGQHDVLRPATREELSQVRQIAKRIVHQLSRIP